MSNVKDKVNKLGKEEEGKQHAFEMGEYFRQRYDNFLGDFYTPNLLEATTTNVNRTKMSLQLVLAGAFPPRGELIWNPNLLWQPIPFNMVPLMEDKLLLGIASCANSMKYFRDLFELPQTWELLRQILDHLGDDVEDLLSEFGVFFYMLPSMTTNLRKLNSGYLLKKIVDDSEGKANGVLVPEGRKIFFYSAHDINVASMLGTLDILDPQLIPYGAYILLELHEFDNVYGFKIYYQNYTTSEPHLMKMPLCDEFCPLETFVALTKKYFPDEDTCGDNIYQ